MLNRKYIRFLFGLTVSSVAFLCISCESYGRQAYDRADWNSIGLSHDNRVDTRRSMAIDIKNRIIKHGMSEFDVQNLLGYPDDRFEKGINRDQMFDINTKICYRYELGRSNSEQHWLDIYFDNSGKVNVCSVHGE